eukprot:1011542-Prymnesium_polylepis.1
MGGKTIRQRRCPENRRGAPSKGSLARVVAVLSSGVDHMPLLVLSVGACAFTHLHLQPQFHIARASRCAIGLADAQPSRDPTLAGQLAVLLPVYAAH